MYNIYHFFEFYYNMRNVKTQKNLVNTTLCYIEKDGCYLMLHRTKKEHDYNHDKWIGIGGKFEAGESPEDCAVREVREETGLEIATGDLEYCGIVTFVDISNEGESLPPGLSPQAVFATPPSAGESPRNAPHVVLFDFGAKFNIQRELEKRGCRVTVVPYNTTAEEVIKINPDGVMLSNGPGDPADNVGVIEEIRKLCAYGKITIFGICLGHQMLALARGAKTSKLKYGHRGGNHPVKDTATNRVYITSQNHGYAVENTSLPYFAKMSFFNVNDGTVEGVDYTDIPAFSVQFHPEACGGPHDTNFLFDRFLKMMEEK